MMIKKGTTRKLRAIASKIFPNDEAYRAFLTGFKHHKTGEPITSTLDLTEAQGKQVIEGLKKIEVSRKEMMADQQKAKGLLSPDQKSYANSLFKQVGIPPGKRQFGFIKKQIGVAKSLDWLTPAEAKKVISGLKNMLKGEQKQEHHLTRIK